MSVIDGDWPRLAEAVLKRREQLGLAQNALGLSPTTVAKIEKGQPVSARAATWRQLERALKWKPGSVRDVLAGEEPTPQDASLDALASALGVSPDDADELVEAIQTLSRILGGRP